MTELLKKEKEKEKEKKETETKGKAKEKNKKIGEGKMRPLCIGDLWGEKGGRNSTTGIYKNRHLLGYYSSGKHDTHFVI